ncbi:MAG: hypothetical protein J7623_20395 [Chitinophaga sp.]|uniref:hypothetical protein n=1 Tax=Chitinophaga sp. TaxID=1869181 RepID=UPI001B1D594E|nr:hypothetical protein [Chitinophaga sp.]MBO9731012.1 hypothetical protein [Chitinophaga sp.]
MNTIGSLKIYDIFRKDMHMPDERALEAVIALDDFFDKKTSGKFDSFATKDEMLNMKNELKQEIHGVSVRLDLMATKTELAAVQSGLKDAIHQSEKALTKSIFHASLYQFLILTGTIFTLLRLMGVFK